MLLLLPLPPAAAPLPVISQAGKLGHLLKVAEIIVQDEATAEAAAECVAVADKHISPADS